MELNAKSGMPYADADGLQVVGITIDCLVDSLPRIDDRVHLEVSRIRQRSVFYHVIETAAVITSFERPVPVESGSRPQRRIRAGDRASRRARRAPMDGD